MPIDTSMYNPSMQQQGQSNDPMHQIANVVQMRNMIGNINKIKGGMPQTGQALDGLGAGAQIPPTCTGQ